MKSSLPFVLERLKALNYLGKTIAHLHWDQQVLLPRDGTTFRGSQLAFLAKLRHEWLTDARYIETLRELRADTQLGENEKVIAREALRDAERAAKVPAKLVEEMVQLETLATVQWEEARKKNSFAHVSSTLAALIEKKREHGEALGTGKTPYDALIDLYEPNTASEEIDKIFAVIRGPLIRLTEAIVSKAGNAAIKLPAKGTFPAAAQKKFFSDVVAAMGFRLSAGRVDESTHPFCSDNCNMDVRLTTRFQEQNIIPGLMAIIHEAGHGLYEQGLPGEHEGTPLGESSSLGIHESQSLLWEKQVGRSLEFWEFLHPMLQAAFPGVLNGARASDFHRVVNQVRRSLIRVDADEVTYGLHVIARYELERDLLLKRLGISDLQHAWREKYRELIGVVPEDDLTGVLQDTHWYIGAFGYFPTYLLGALNAAQLFSTFREKHPAAREDIRRGRFSPLLEWLRENIHRHGRRYSPSEMIAKATGRPLDPRIYVDYLNRKYSELYDLRDTTSGAISG